MRAAAIVRTNSNGSIGFAAVQRRAFDLDQVVDRHRLRIRIEIGELRDQPGALGARFAHADDPAATDAHARRADALERVEPVAVIARGDDLAVEVRRGIEIVIVVIEPGVLQSLGLAVLEHAERRASLESQRLDLAHHRQHRFQIAIFRAAPCRAHAEAGRTCRLGRGRRGGDLGQRKHRLIVDAGVVARGLRAISRSPPGSRRS